MPDPVIDRPVVSVDDDFEDEFPDARRAATLCAATLIRTANRLLWEIDSRIRTVAVYTSPERRVVLAESQSLDGGDVLPGFSLPLNDLFAELDRAEAE